MKRIAVIGAMSVLLILCLSSFSNVFAVTTTEKVTFTVANSGPIDDALGSSANLLAYYPLDENTATTTYDMSGNFNLGTLANSPTWRSVGCEFNNCLNFTDTDQHVNLGSPIITTGGSWTVTAWFYWFKIQSTHNAASMIVGNYNGNFNGFRFYVENSDKKMCGDVGNSVGSHIFVLCDGVTSGVTWTFGAITFDSVAKNLCIYMNNLAGTCSGTLAFTPAPETANAWMGEGQWGGSMFWQWYGRIDDVRFYSVALSSTQVGTLFGQTSPLQQLVSITGCAPTQTIIPMDNHQYTFTATSSCSITYTLPADFANNRYRLRDDTSSTAVTTWTYTTAASGTDTVANTTYYQLHNTFSATPVSPATWDNNYNIPVLETFVGQPITGCTLSALDGGGVVSCSFWSDYNKAVTLPAAIINWFATPTGSNSFTVTTGGNTNNVNYNQISLVPLQSTNPWIAPLVMFTLLSFAVSLLALRRRT